MTENRETRKQFPRFVLILCGHGKTIQCGKTVVISTCVQTCHHRPHREIVQEKLVVQDPGDGALKFC